MEVDGTGIRKYANIYLFHKIGLFITDYINSYSLVSFNWVQVQVYYCWTNQPQDLSSYKDIYSHQYLLHTCITSNRLHTLKKIIITLDIRLMKNTY